MEICKKIILIFVLILFISACCPKQSITRIERDTVTIQVKDRSFNFSDSLKIKVTSDSILSFKPFIGEINKALNNKDTVIIRYQYPMNRIEVFYKTPPDTNRREIKERKLTETIIKSRAWWEVPVYVVLGLLLGSFAYIGAKIKRWV